MSEPVYLISEAVKLTETKAHVLRYWEEELMLPISRNQNGHRTYTGQDIQVFLGIRELKKKGYSLKEIGGMIPNIRCAGIVPEAFEIGEAVLDMPDLPMEESMEDEKLEQFQEILERVLDQILLNDRQEARYKRLDEAIRKHQQSRREVAVTKEQEKRKGFFRRKK